jgi:hypothetical protein
MEKNKSLMIFILKRILRFSPAIIILVMISQSVRAQTSITGPDCVVPGFVYHYIISGAWDSTSNMQLCVTGGSFKSNDSTLHNCTKKGGAPLGSVLIVWNNPGTGSLSVSSALGNFSFNVTVVLPMHPGLIDTASKYQKIGYGTIPSAIVCSNDMGGNCTPIFSNQWQQSSDKVSWINISGSTGKIFQPGPLTVSTFFRRRVTEKNSGTIDYSDIAEVDVLFKNQ